MQNGGTNVIGCVARAQQVPESPADRGSSSSSRTIKIILSKQHPIHPTSPCHKQEKLRPSKGRSQEGGSKEESPGLLSLPCTGSLGISRLRVPWASSAFSYIPAFLSTQKYTHTQLQMEVSKREDILLPMSDLELLCALKGLLGGEPRAGQVSRSPSGVCYIRMWLTEFSLQR